MPFSSLMILVGGHDKTVPHSTFLRQNVCSLTEARRLAIWLPRRPLIEPVLSHRTQRRKNGSGCSSCMGKLVLKTSVRSSRTYHVTVIIRGHLCQEEGKFRGHIDAHTKLFCEVGVAVGVGKDDVNDFARTAQGRWAYVHTGQ
jgi:hypothetical protein